MRPQASAPSLLTLHLFWMTALLATLALLLLTGCGMGPRLIPTASGTSIQGKVHGGQQPVAGSQVYLLAANTTGFGHHSVSLLDAASTGYSSKLGAYVISAADGTFDITGDYTCAPGAQVYLYASGGDPGIGSNNPVIGLMAVIGSCPQAGNFSTVPFVEINEVTTVAAAYALSGFAVDAVDIADDEGVLSNVTAAAARTGMANAFANAANLVDLGSGTALQFTPAANGYAPQTTLNTLANILAACVNTNGAMTASDSSELPCGTLISATSQDGVPVPTDTAGVAINIAHSPAYNVDTLWTLPTSTAPFYPALTSEPQDFTLGFYFFPGYQTTGLAGVAIDASGNVWLSDFTADRIAELSPSGAVLSGPSGYTDDSLNQPYPMAIDTSGNVWALNAGTTNSSITGFTNSGAYITYAPTSAVSSGIAIDASGNILVADFQGDNANRIDQFSPSGVYTTSFTGGGLNQPYDLAVDASSNLWAANYGAGNVSQFTTAGAATATYAADSITSPVSIAIDSPGDVWVLNGDASISGITSAGTALSAPPFLTGTGYTPVIGSLAIDGQNNLWSMAYDSEEDFYLFGITPSGAPLTSPSGFFLGAIGYPGGLALDSSGNMWITDSFFVAEIIGRAAPVVTPLAAAVTVNKIATLP